MARYRNIGLFVLLGAIWGGAYPVIKLGLEYMPPVVFAAVRYDIAGLTMLCYVFFAADYWRPRTRKDWISAVVGGVLIIAAYNAFLFIGEQTVKSAVVGILVGMMPVLSAAFSKVLIPEESLDAYGVAGITLGFVGIVLVAQPSLSNLLTSGIVGQLFVLSAAASMALGSVLTEKVGASQPVKTMESWSMMIGAIVLHGVALLRPTEELASIRWTFEAALVMGYLALLSSAVAYFIYFDLLDRLGPIEMNFIAYAAAGFGALFSWLLLGEHLGPVTVTGFAMIVCGFLLLKRDEIYREVAEYRTLRNNAE